MFSKVKVTLITLPGRTYWASGSAFDCRSRGPWIESYTGLSQDTRNESPKLHSTNV